MKQIICIFLVCCFWYSSCFGGMVIKKSSSASSTTYYVGYGKSSPTTSSTYASVPDETAYPVSADRVAARRWTATVAGTAVAVHVRRGSSWGSTGYGRIYSGASSSSLEATGTMSGSSGNTWERIEFDSEYEFASSEVLYFGVGADWSSSTYIGGIDASGTKYYVAATVTSTTPTSVSSWSSSADDLGFILEFTTD